MKSEKFRVLGTDEYNFMYGWGVNTLSTDFHSKIARCHFLSPIAKLLFHNLKLYSIGKKNCFPSVDTLKAELGMKKPTIIKYIHELEAANLIKVTRRGFNKTNFYELQNLYGNPLLVHSEILHKIKPRKDRHRSIYFAGVEEYRESDLCKKILDSREPFKYYRNIKEWFTNYMKGYGVTLVLIEDSEDGVEVISEDMDLSALMKCANISTEEVSHDPVINGKVRKKKKSNKDFSMPTNEWNSQTFLNYFEFLYRGKYKTVYFSETRKDLNFLSTLIKRVDDNDLVKKHMELFFEGGEVFNIVKVSAFCSNHIQNTLTIYRETGSLPKFKKQQDSPDKQTEGSKPNKSYEDEVEDIFGD